MTMTNFLKDRVAKIYQHPFFRKTLFTIIARLGGMSMQLAYFVLVARALTVHEYGMFIGVSAMASLLISFASFGSSDILVKYVSRDRSLFAKYWGNAILTGSIGSTFLIFTCLLASQLFFPDHGSPLVVFLVLLSDILCLMLWNISCDALGSHDKLYQVAQADILYSANKLIAAVILTLEVWESTLQTWAWLYCASSLATGLICVIFVNATLGMPKFQPSLALANIKEGIYFSLSYSADKVNGDIDKTMLASVATFEAAGIYAAGSRFLTAAYAPLHVLFKNAYMRYFKHGESGIQGSFGFAKRLWPAVVAYGCLIMVAFIGLAPLLPRVLGESYGETVTVLRWLSPYVLILGVQAIAGDSLTGAGFQSWRSGVNVAAALLNIALNLWMIPHYLWKGAIWSTLISDGSKLLVLWVMVLMLQYRDRNYAQGAVR